LYAGEKYISKICDWVGGPMGKRFEAVPKWDFTAETQRNGETRGEERKEERENGVSRERGALLAPAAGGAKMGIDWPANDRYGASVWGFGLS
jgi:hypothetical protein